jgi:hypothetical protein
MVDAHVFRVAANDGDGIVGAVDDDDGCEDAVVAEVPPAGRNNADAAGADADELPAIILVDWLERSKTIKLLHCLEQSNPVIDAGSTRQKKKEKDEKEYELLLLRHS